ncbi:cold shock domain-containing protein CspD [Lonepinella sp. MS14437]|uniref:cold shock domain-containing protein CspD n=1 Tax=unclassified Lonepinella TaxID=2642006 RepID=UPI0036DA2A93
MEVGVVKWFNNVKGFGFINAEGSDEDIFAHFSVIEMDGYRSLKAGQKVNFEVVHGDKGSQATKIIPIIE